MVKINKTVSILVVMIVFAIGWLSSSLYAITTLDDKQSPFPSLFSNGFVVNTKAVEQLSPGNHVKEEQIHVYNDKVIIELQDPHWSAFKNTNSMDPLIDEYANGLEIKPDFPEQITVGDVISYKSEFADGIIIHRVINIGFDSKGWYAKVKGDNNPEQDPGKIRFSQIQGILVGVIY